eukprot:g357.t1
MPESKIGGITGRAVSRRRAGSTLSPRVRAVRRAWRTIDTDHSNSVTKEEFRAALNDFNIQMKDSEFEKLVSNMAFGSNGTIEYEQFQPSKKSGWISLKDFCKALRKEVNCISKGEARDLATAFSREDKDGHQEVNFTRVLKSIVGHGGK